MQITGNLGLKKPEGTDVVNIDDLNYNADILDQEVVKRIINSGGVPSIQAGADASKSPAGTAGRLYIATDTNKIYRDTGSVWQLIGSINWNDITGKPASFTPAVHKSTHATGGSDALTPADIGAATASHTHTKSQITDFPSSLPANGGNADTVDNKHASDFAPAGYGLGGLGIRLAGGIDLNTIISNGWYDVQNPVNGVSGLTWHKLLVVASADGNYITQLVFSMTEGSDMYMRHRVAGTWGSWYRIAKATEIPTSLPANGGNADTVDGKHASDLVQKAGDTMTGALTVPNLIAKVTIPSSSGPSAWPAGFVAGTVYNNGYPVAYGTIFSYKGTTGNSCVQILQAWPGTDGGEAYLYIRSARDTGTDVFGPWRKVWSENNDGAGSGLDADMIRGIKITSSTTAPSTPAVGDIWFDLN